MMVCGAFSTKILFLKFREATDKKNGGEMHDIPMFWT